MIFLGFDFAYWNLRCFYYAFNAGLTDLLLQNTPAAAVLTLSHITKSFGRDLTVNDVSLEVHPGVGWCCWVKQYQPDRNAEIDSVLMAHDYLRYCLTGGAPHMLITSTVISPARA